MLRSRLAKRWLIGSWPGIAIADESGLPKIAGPVRLAEFILEDLDIDSGFEDILLVMLAAPGGYMSYAGYLLV